MGFVIVLVRIHQGKIFLIYSVRQINSIQFPLPFSCLAPTLMAIIQNCHVEPSLSCVHIYLLSSDWEKVCGCRNVSVKLPCVYSYVCLSPKRSLHFFGKSFLFLFLFLCYPYFGTFFPHFLFFPNSNIILREDLLASVVLG